MYNEGETVVWNVLSLSVWRFRPRSALHWEREENESLETPAWRIWCSSKSGEYAVLPLHYCLNWDDSSGSALPIILTAAPCHSDGKVGALPASFPAPSSSPGQHSQPNLRYTGRAEVDGGEGEAGSSLRQNFHQDQQRVSMSWDCVTAPIETMQEALPFPQWQYVKAVSISTNK